MSKKKLNNESNINRLEKKNKIIKKSTKINSLNKRDNSTTNHTNLKAKKKSIKMSLLQIINVKK